MDSPNLEPGVVSRWGVAAGVAFAILTLYALVGPPWPPPGDAPAEAWQAHLASGPNRVGLLAGAVAGVIGAVLFIAFMATLRQRGLLLPEGRNLFGYGCGLLFAVNLINAYCAWVTVPAGIEISGEPIPSGDLIRYLNDLGQAFVAIPAPLCAGVFAAVVAGNVRRSDVVPRWLGTAGMAVAIAQLGGVFFFPLLLFPVWIASLSAALLTRRRRPPTASPGVAPACRAQHQPTAIVLPTTIAVALTFLAAISLLVRPAANRPQRVAPTPTVLEAMRLEAGHRRSANRPVQPAPIDSPTASGTTTSASPAPTRTTGADAGASALRSRVH